MPKLFLSLLLVFGLTGCSTGVNISSSDATSVISSAIGAEVNQDDPYRGIMFPSIKNQAEIFSAPYVVLMVFPDTASLKAGLEGFKQDIANWNGIQYYRYCNNVLVEYELAYDQSIKAALSRWCTYND